MPITALPLVLSLVGCKEVVQAPTELDELVGFLFEHTADEDDDALAAGAVNLDTWLIDGMEETAEGYKVNDLTPEALEQVGYGQLDEEAISGAAIGHVSIHEPEPLVETATSVSAADIYGGSYTLYDRTYLTDLDCFNDKDCALLDSEIHQIADYSILTVESHSQVQYRWVETDIGWVMVERTWLIEAATIEPDNIVDLNAQFFIWAVIPAGDGTARTIQATWVAAELLLGDMDGDVALNIMIDSMGKAQETLDEYVSEN